VPARFDFIDRFDCSARPVGRGECLMWGDKIDQMMRNATTLIERNLRGGDFNLLINLDGIAVDDLAAEMQGYFDPQVALARCRGTNDSDDVAQTVSLRWLGALKHGVFQIRLLLDPVASTTPRGLPARGPRTARGTDIRRKLTVCATVR